MTNFNDSLAGVVLEHLIFKTITKTKTTDDFVFLYTSEKISKPLTDDLAALFLKPSNQLVKSLLKGHSTSDSLKRSKNLFIKNIQGLLTSESSLYDYALPYLIWNVKHLVCLGDKEASFH